MGIFSAITLAIPVVALVVATFIIFTRNKGASEADAPRDSYSWMRINGAKQIVHIRGSGKPGCFDGVRCSALVKTVPKDKEGKYIDGYTVTLGCEFPCEFVDSSLRFWCRFHVPADAQVLERAVAEGDGFADGVCVAHGIDCPKPWSLA